VKTERLAWLAAKREYARLVGDDRRYVKGKKFGLLTRWDNLTNDKRDGLRELFRVNRRLYKAYLSFPTLWSQF
jgi:transposase